MHGWSACLWCYLGRLGGVALLGEVCLWKLGFGSWKTHTFHFWLSLLRASVHHILRASVDHVLRASGHHASPQLSPCLPLAAMPLSPWTLLSLESLASGTSSFSKLPWSWCFITATEKLLLHQCANSVLIPAIP